MKEICEWNDFVIFHEYITFWASFRSGLNDIMDGCPFRFTFKSGFNFPAKVLAYSNEN